MLGVRRQTSQARRERERPVGKKGSTGQGARRVGLRQEPGTHQPSSDTANRRLTEGRTKLQGSRTSTKNHEAAAQPQPPRAPRYKNWRRRPGEGGGKGRSQPGSVRQRQLHTDGRQDEGTRLEQTGNGKPPINDMSKPECSVQTINHLLTTQQQ